MLDGSTLITGKRILVVEDDTILAVMIVADLEDHGAIVLGPLRSRADTMSILADGVRFDAAILDINLVDGDVYEAADLLRERKAKFVFASSVTRSELPHRFDEVPLFFKPMDMRRYLEAQFAEDADL